MFQSTPLRGAKARAVNASIQTLKRFNPRPCAGRKRDLPQRCWRIPRFNPRPCAGRKCRGSWPRWSRSSSFNPRPCAGRKPMRPYPKSGRQRCFNPRPCAGRKPTPSTMGMTKPAFQSTPLRGAKAAARHGQADAGRVSIHAPARGERDHPLRLRWRLLVSIHAPARGESRRVLAAARSRGGFNPRPCAGRKRSANRQDRQEPHAVSIHAPARGESVDYFEAWISTAVSIHAPARGERTAPTGTLSVDTCFNPRPCAGRKG